MSPAFKIPFQDLPQQTRALRSELDPAMETVLRHCQFILGPEVTEFERTFAEHTGAAYAIGVGSGTDALQFILRGLDIGAGDEVITVANTFIATAEAISYAGARPVLVDCGLDDFRIDPAAIEAAITPRTRAVIPVHLYGQPANIEVIAAIAAKHGLALVEDAAQAHGARDRDAVAKALLDRGVQTVVHYPVPIYLQKAYAGLGYPPGSFPNAEAAARTVLSLPMFPEMTREQCDYVGAMLREVLS
ncbi:MAG: aminotransferase class V-fold PLP-dependent enzyme [Opitutaceae bacterium]|nr:aminotransferase class V-fold PLP-dependent enzyme [Opitutaceae bacterium]